MVKAFTDPEEYKELSLDGEIIAVVHIYYGCPNEQCNTIARLIFRKDGLPGDLHKVMMQRRAEGDPIVQEMPGDMEQMLDI
jgi:hypothetical protein